MKFIIDTVYSKRDIYGNVYNYSTITNVETNKSASFQGGWGSSDNLYCYFRKLGVDSNQLHRSGKTIGKREFNKQTKNMQFLKDEKQLAKALKELE